MRSRSRSVCDGLRSGRPLCSARGSPASRAGALCGFRQGPPGALPPFPRHPAARHVACHGHAAHSRPSTLWLRAGSMAVSLRTARHPRTHHCPKGRGRPLVRRSVAAGPRPMSRFVPNASTCGGIGRARQAHKSKDHRQGDLMCSEQAWQQSCGADVARRDIADDLAAC